MSSSREKKPSQKRAVKTRAKILSAVESLVEKKPGEFVTSSEIASEAGVAVGTLYRYFDDASAAILKAYDRAHERVNGCWFQGLSKLTDLSSEDAARAFLKTYRTCARRERAYVPLLILARKIRPAAVEFEANVDTPESHRAFANIFQISPTKEKLAAIRLLKFVTLQLMDAYFTARADDQSAIRDEIIRYTEQALQRLRA
ncbi:MAG: TetR/AcrR family transcriptional regulator [Pseudomonadota bacterium]